MREDMRRLGVLLSTVLLIGTGSAAAQDSKRGEVSGGWRYYHTAIKIAEPQFGLPLPKDLPKGWFADVAINLSPTFAIVGDVGGTYHSDETNQTINEATTITQSLDFRFHTFMGGVRVRAPQLAATALFCQVLFGREHDSNTRERTITHLVDPLRLRDSASNAVLALDGGITISVVRASVGYVRFFDDADAHAFRFSLGGAVRF
jgi:hypothetical protein